MGLVERLRQGLRLAVHLGNNWVSVLGAALTTAAALTLVWFWLLEITSPHPVHPYVGIVLFVILPALFVLGLRPDSRRHPLAAGGGWRARAGSLAEYPGIHLDSPAVRNVLLLVGGATSR